MIKQKLEKILPGRIRKPIGRFIRFLSIQEFFRIRFPSRADIEMTNICNLRCVMCPELTMSRKKGFIEFDTFKKIIDECAIHEVPDIRLNFMGESLLHPKFNDLILYAKKRMKNVGLNTNACFLNKELSKNIINAKLDWILFSLDAVTKETYEKIRIGGDFDITMSNVENFFNIRADKKTLTPRVTVQFIEQKENYKERNEFIKKWSPFIRDNDNITIKFANDWGGRVKDVGTFISEPIHEVCITPWQSMTFLWTGEAVMCCVDTDGEFVLGNVNNETMYNIWNNLKYKEFRNIVKNKYYEKLPICSGCDKTSGRSYYNMTINKNEIIG